MNKQLFAFAVVGLLWCFGLGLFFYNPVGVVKIVAQKTISSLSSDLSAGIILSTEKPAAVKLATVPVAILIFGDMMLDRKVREQMNKNGPEYPFALIKDFLKGDGHANDIVVANAEGPFTYNKSVTLGKKDAPLQFTFNPAILPTLKNLGFTLLGQANNHTLNFGMAGFRQSTSSIETAGLDWFGDPRNKEVKPYVAEIRGEKVAFIGYNEFAYQGLNNVLQAIKDAKKDATFVAVYPHWGEEYKMNFTLTQQKTAHAFIDAGADVVIGAHPHVTEPVEMYNGKPIFYSLGNFIFDQASTGPTSRGLAVKISLVPNYATYDLFPISIVKQQAILMTAGERQKELDRVNVQAGTIIVPRERTVKPETTSENLNIDPNTKIIQINGATIRAELATTTAEQIHGLSGRTSLASGTGMFFVFGHSSNWGIWMKDMRFPIDVLWVTDSLKVSDIVENMLPSSYPQAYTPHVPVRYVLEVPAGTVKNYGIMIGQNVDVK